MKCMKGYEVEVMKSPAGYYLGTRDKEGFPNRQTNCIENEYCNGGRGCFDADADI